MVGIADHHLGRTACGAARFDRACCAVTDLEETHQARGLAAARQRLVRRAERGEVGAGAGAILEQTRLADPEVHDAAIADQIVCHRLNEACMGLRVLVSRRGFGQFARLVIHIVVTLARAVDAIGPVQTRVKPLRAVRCGLLRGQHEAHLIEIGLRVFFGREVTAFPAPIGPRARQTVEDLLGGRLTRALCVVAFRNRAPQETGHALFLDLLQRDRDPCLAKILLCDDVTSNLAPAFGNLYIVQLEHNRPVGIANFRRGRHKLDPRICVLACFRELSFDFHRNGLFFVTTPSLLQATKGQQDRSRAPLRARKAPQAYKSVFPSLASAKTLYVVVD